MQKAICEFALRPVPIEVLSVASLRDVLDGLGHALAGGDR
jgi:hypothetical protein